MQHQQGWNKMAGFGTLSLAQTALGVLFDQRAVVLYEQPENFVANNTIVSTLWGRSAGYNELFAGLLSGELGGGMATVLNTAGANPYGVTYISCRVNVESDLCDHPVETGEVITDYAIIKPVSAQIELAMPTFFAERIYNRMMDIYKKKQKKILLQTKYGIYENLVLKDMTYSMDNNTVDRTRFTLTLREVRMVNPQFFDKNIVYPSDDDTVNTGTQIAGELS